MYYFVYLVTNKINNKKYIGQHATDNINDSYLGSGVNIKKAIKKYGKENFSREILAFAKNQKELDLLEIELIEKYNAVNDPDFYNLAEGGLGRHGFNWDEEHKQQMSQILKELYATGKKIPVAQKWTPKRKQEVSDRLKHEFATGKRISPAKGKFGEEASFYGKHHSAKTKEILSRQKKEQWANGDYDNIYTPERAKKISETRKKKFANGEYKIPDVSGEKNPMYGRTKEKSPVYGTHKTKEERESLSKIVKAQYENGRVPPMLGKHWSDEVKDKISNSHKGIGVGAKNGRARAVICIETNEYFSCIKEAVEKYNCSRSSITDCCRGKIKSTKGLHWKYASQANTVPSSNTEKV